MDGEPTLASSRHELKGLLRDLERGRDERAAFAALCEHARADRFRDSMPYLVRRAAKAAARRRNGNRSLLVLVLAEVAHWHRWVWAPVRNPLVRKELSAAVPILVVLVGDSDPSVRRVAPYALREILASGFGDDGSAGWPTVAGPIRERAAVEDDPMALAGQIRALDDLDRASAPGSTPRWWSASWLRHPSPEVRIAAVGAVADRDETGADGSALGTVAAEALMSSWPRLWQDSAWKAPSPWMAALRIGDRLADRPHECARLASALFAHENVELSRAAPDFAAAVLDRWRLPMPQLWAALADGLTDPEVRYRSAELLTTGGEAVRPHTAALLAAIEQDDSTIATDAALALASLGDARAIPCLTHRIPTRSFWPINRAVADLVVPLRDRAADVLPALRVSLRNPTATTEHTLDLLAAWGPASADAVPELVDLLEDLAHATRSCVVLGRIGPPAHAAANALEQLAVGRRRPPARGGGPGPRWHGRQQAAWAYWRITGAAEPALALLGRAVRRGPGHAVLSYLAEFGPLAAAHAAPVRNLLDGPGGWSRVEAAHAWWRITGDPAPAVPVLIAATEPLRHRRTSPLVRAAVRYLGAIGGPAEAALPLLDAALAGDRRLHDPHSRRPIHDDDALVGDARAAVDRIRARSVAARDADRPGSASGAGFGTAG